MPENEINTAEQAGRKTGTLTIDGTSYPMDQLSEEARAQLASIQATDKLIARLKQQLAIAQTARSVYAGTLKRALTPSE